jgi:hypothetical protein
MAARGVEQPTGGAGDDAFPALSGVQMCHLVVGAPQLEAKDWLEVLAFQQHIAFQSFAQVCGMSQRRFLNNLVDFGGQNEPEVLGQSACYKPIGLWRTSGVPFGSRKASGTPYDLSVSAPDLVDGDGFAAYSVRAKL